MSTTRHVRNVGRESVPISEALVIKVRRELYMNMYEIAKEHRDLATQVASKDMKAEISESMISILFCYTCLEAYINTVGKDRLGNDWQKYAGKDVSTKSKWLGVTRDLASDRLGTPHSVFSKSKEPFKSFCVLEEIRTGDLIHRKARFVDVVDTKYGRTEGTIDVLNSDKADWACRIVNDMVSTLNDNIDNPLPIDWL